MILAVFDNNTLGIQHQGQVTIFMSTGTRPTVRMYLPRVPSSRSSLSHVASILFFRCCRQTVPSSSRILGWWNVVHEETRWTESSPRTWPAKSKLKPYL